MGSRNRRSLGRRTPSKSEISARKKSQKEETQPKIENESSINFTKEVKSCVEENRRELLTTTSKETSELKVKLIRGRQLQVAMKRSGVEITIPASWEIEVDPGLLMLLLEKYNLSPTTKVGEPQEVSGEESTITVGESQEESKIDVDKEETYKDEFFSELVEFARDLYKQGVDYQKLRQKVYDKMYNSKKLPEGFSKYGEATVAVLEVLFKDLIAKGEVTKEEVINYLGRAAKKFSL
jgi:hypothetical protein